MSEVWTTSAMARFAPASCITFWKMRWEPSRVSSQVMPSAFLLKASQTFWATDRPSDEYQTTFPSFFAASITAGSAASTRATSPSARASPIRSPQSLRCVMVALLSFRVWPACPAAPGSRGAPEGRGRRGDVRPLGRSRAAARSSVSTCAPGSARAALARNFASSSSSANGCSGPPRGASCVSSSTRSVDDLDPHVPREAPGVRQGRIHDVAHLAGHLQDTRVARLRLAEPVDPRLALHEDERDAVREAELGAVGSRRAALLRERLPEPMDRALRRPADDLAGSPPDRTRAARGSAPRSPCRAG